ncbi:hypothetical protein K8T06_18375, partial [bacterium]|nr:hypothetical protein [bacterium]
MCKSVEHRATLSVSTPLVWWKTDGKDRGAVQIIWMMYTSHEQLGKVEQSEIMPSTGGAGLSGEKDLLRQTAAIIPPYALNFSRSSFNQVFAPGKVSLSPAFYSEKKEDRPMTRIIDTFLPVLRRWKPQEFNEISAIFERIITYSCDNADNPVESKSSSDQSVVLDKISRDMDRNFFSHIYAPIPEESKLEEALSAGKTVI